MGRVLVAGLVKRMSTKRRLSYSLRFLMARLMYLRTWSRCVLSFVSWCTASIPSMSSFLLVEGAHRTPRVMRSSRRGAIPWIFSPRCSSLALTLLSGTVLALAVWSNYRCFWVCSFGFLA